MTPLFFGTGARRLFGIYLPARGRARRRGVVLCHPWGPEYIRAHRAMRQFSKGLADAGFEVFGFDYYGTGDSAGDMTDAHIEGWLDDIDMAIDELMDTTGLTRVTLAGLRLGATLAAAAAVRRARDVEALVLWDPIRDGAEYIKDLQAGSGWVRPRRVEDGGGHEIDGFPLTDAMSRQLRELRLPELAARPIPTLAVFSRPEAATPAACQDVAAGAGPVLVEHLPDESPWADELVFGSRPLPVKTIQRMVAWLS